MAKRELSVTLFSIFGIVLLSLGSAFAVFTTTNRSKDYNVIKVGTLNIVFGEDSDNTINLNGQYPVSDAVGLQSTPYTFTITNTGTLAADYTVSILDDEDMITQDNCSGNQLNKSYIKYSLDGSTAGLLNDIAPSNYQIDTGTLAAGASKTYTLYVWIAENVGNDVLDKHYHGKIVVNGVNEQGEPVASVLLANIGENGAINTDDPGQTFITGENPNNYIWYSGKLWRAVSVDPANNSVKLVTQWNISTLPYYTYNQSNTSFTGSYMEEWLNDESVDGFLGNLREPEKFIRMDSQWNTIEMEDGFDISDVANVEDAVGLLNMHEYSMITSTGNYLDNGLCWWTLTPFNETNIWFISLDGSPDNYGSAGAIGIRPAINLKPGVKIVGGSGMEDDPYRLSGDNDTPANGTLLSTRYSGEYIRFGTGADDLYRIVSHENENSIKIVSSNPLEESIAFSEGSSIDNYPDYFDENIPIGYFLNNDYLNYHLTAEQIAMIEDSSTWYLGGTEMCSSYPCIDSSIESKVGLLRVGEQLSGQFDIHMSYWLLTSQSGTYIWTIDETGFMIGDQPNDNKAIRPALFLKSGVYITSGSGTKEDPFEISM